MKLAISGSACTGKTTLANRIASEIGSTFVPEHYDLLFSRPGKFNGPAEDLVELFNSVLSVKVREERKQSRFISDRSPIDLFNLWMARGLWRRDEDTRKFHKRCQHYACYYDYVILLPFGVLPFKQMDGAVDGQRRIMNKWVQYHNHANISGLANLWLPAEKIIDVPGSELSVNERIGYLRARTGCDWLPSDDSEATAVPG